MPARNYRNDYSRDVIGPNANVSTTNCTTIPNGEFIFGDDINHITYNFGIKTILLRPANLLKTRVVYGTGGEDIGHAYGNLTTLGHLRPWMSTLDLELEADLDRIDLMLAVIKQHHRSLITNGAALEAFSEACTTTVDRLNCMMCNRAIAFASSDTNDWMCRICNPRRPEPVPPRNRIPGLDYREHPSANDQPSPWVAVTDNSGEALPPINISSNVGRLRTSIPRPRARPNIPTTPRLDELGHGETL